MIFTRCREHMRLCIKCISKVSAVVKFMAAWVLVFQTCCCASLCAQHCVALRDHASKLCKVGSYLKMFLAWRCFYYSLGCREVRPVIRVPTCTRSHFPGAALQNHTGTEAHFLSKNCNNHILHFALKICNFVIFYIQHRWNQTKSLISSSFSSKFFNWLNGQKFDFCPSVQASLRDMWPTPKKQGCLSLCSPFLAVKKVSNIAISKTQPSENNLLVVENKHNHGGEAAAVLRGHCHRPPRLTVCSLYMAE